MIGDPIRNPGTTGRGVRPRAPALWPASVSPCCVSVSTSPEFPGERGTRWAPENPNWHSGAPTYLPHPGGTRPGVSAAGRPRPPARANKDAPERERALPAALAGGGQPCPVAVRASRVWAARGPGQSRGPRPGCLLQPCALAPARIPTLSPGATHESRRAFTSSRLLPPFFPCPSFGDLSWSKES